MHCDLPEKNDKMFPDLLAESRSRPFSIPPAIVTSLVHNLHKINPLYYQLNKPLFSTYLPGIEPPMTEADLEVQREADRMLQKELRESGFNQTDQSRKRALALDD